MTFLHLKCNFQFIAFNMQNLQLLTTLEKQKNAGAGGHKLPFTRLGENFLPVRFKQVPVMLFQFGYKQIIWQVIELAVFV